MHWKLLPALVLAGCLAGPALAARGIEPAVDFLPAAPVIDGHLDAGLRALPVRQFPEVIREDHGRGAPAVTWRMAYGADFLYLFIQVAADRPVCRDRGYQNGDGFHLVLARPRPDGGASDEFYVLGFSAVDDPASFYRQMIWYYNVGLAFRRLDHGTRFDVSASRGRVGFELLLPWAEVYPYQPWLSGGIGFNLCFVKAAPGGRKIYYCLLQDPKMQSEQSRRLCLPLHFKSPVLPQGIQAALAMDRNAATGTVLPARLAIVAASPGSERIRVRVCSGEGEVLASQAYPLECAKGLTVHEIGLPTRELTPGGYSVEWQAPSGRSGGVIGLTLLPAVSPDDLERRLGGAGDRIAPGSRTTLEFLLEELRQRAERRRPYDTAARERLELDRFLGALEQAKSGEDAVAHQRGVFRRAFRSRQDGTLQPYSVYIPPDFQPGRKYPLLVYLHGSGQDDREQLVWLKTDLPDVIAIAPFGRGTSHFYLTPDSQEDIREAMEDVQRNYPIDPSRKILAGFSMGGYGVYRTFAENPSLFRALAVFSGRPNLGSHAGAREAGEIDFLQPGQVARFKGMPLFIAHGRLDMNCPFADTERLVALLKEAGANVEFHVDEAEGHNTSLETRGVFLAWLRSALESRDGKAGHAGGRQAP